jgi:hypothetical protein
LGGINGILSVKESKISISNNTNSHDDEDCGSGDFHDCRSLWYAVINRLLITSENSTIFVNGTLDLTEGVDVAGISMSSRDWYNIYSTYGIINISYPLTITISTYNYDRRSTLFEYLEFNILRYHLLNETLIKVVSYESPYYFSGNITFNNIIFRYISLYKETPLIFLDLLEILFSNVSIYGGGIIFEVERPNLPLLNPKPSSPAISIWRCNGTFELCYFTNISSWVIYLNESTFRFIKNNKFINNAITSSELYPSIRHNIYCDHKTNMTIADIMLPGIVTDTRHSFFIYKSDDSKINFGPDYSVFVPEINNFTFYLNMTESSGNINITGDMFFPGIVTLQFIIIDFNKKDPSSSLDIIEVAKRFDLKVSSEYEAYGEFIFDNSTNSSSSSSSSFSSFSSLSSLFSSSAPPSPDYLFNPSIPGNYTFFVLINNIVLYSTATLLLFVPEPNGPGIGNIKI